MCIGIPMAVTHIEDRTATVAEGGLSLQVSLALLEDVAVGDYVLVHAGFAITRLDAAEGLETLELLRQAGIIAREGGAD